MALIIVIYFYLVAKMTTIFLCHVCYSSFTTSSTAYLKCLSSWRSWKGSLHGTTYWVCCSGESSLVCKLCHSLHGFKKQSPCARFEKLAILFKPLGWNIVS